MKIDIILEMPPRDYSLAEIARIVESEGTKILRKAKADIFRKLSEIDDQKDKNLLQTFPSKILVFGCGPNPMMEDIRKYSVELGLTHHIETFEL